MQQNTKWKKQHSLQKNKHMKDNQPKIQKVRIIYILLYTGCPKNPTFSTTNSCTDLNIVFLGYPVPDLILY